MHELYKSFNCDLSKSSVRVKAMAISPSNDYLVCGCSDGQVQVLGFREKVFDNFGVPEQVICSIDLSCFGEINCFSFYKGKTVELCVGTDKCVNIINWKEMLFKIENCARNEDKSDKTLIKKITHRGDLKTYSLCVDDNTSKLYCGTASNIVFVYDLNTLLPLESISAAHILAVTHLEIHPQSRQLFSSGRDGFLAISDLDSSSPKTVINCQNGTILPKTPSFGQIGRQKLSKNSIMALDAEKEYAFVFNANNTLQLYHLCTEMLVKAKVFSEMVTCAAFDDDDILFGTHTGAIKKWEISTDSIESVTKLENGKPVECIHLIRNITSRPKNPLSGHADHRSTKCFLFSGEGPRVKVCFRKDGATLATKAFVLK